MVYSQTAMQEWSCGMALGVFQPSHGNILIRFDDRGGGASS
jgi:hypothetical protein